MVHSCAGVPGNLYLGATRQLAIYSFPRVKKYTQLEKPVAIPALASATVFLLLTDEQAPSLNLAEGRYETLEPAEDRCRRQRSEAARLR